ncbi:hypothetical protein HAX54_017677, partial [Datura stramonium]|nr:hypothetical protein [Datura stramonium]
KLDEKRREGKQRSQCAKPVKTLVPKHGALPTSRWNPESEEKEERTSSPSAKCWCQFKKGGS